jgi:hypothetical protein
VLLPREYDYIPSPRSICSSMHLITEKDSEIFADFGKYTAERSRIGYRRWMLLLWWTPALSTIS